MNADERRQKKYIAKARVDLKQITEEHEGKEKNEIN